MVQENTSASGKKPGSGVRAGRQSGSTGERVQGGCAGETWAGRRVQGGFPRRDHAEGSSTMKFIEECSPKQVYTVHGSTKELAKQVEKQLGISAQPLPKYGEVALETFN